MNEVVIFKALADPTRLKIIELLKHGEKCICEIIPETDKSQPAVSQHLKILKNAGIVSERKNGTRVIVWVSKKEVFSLIDQVKKLQ